MQLVEKRPDTFKLGKKMREKAREALRCIPADCSRDIWVQVGMACQAAGLTFEDFDSWSAKGGERYAGSADCLKVWRSFRGSGVGPGTLFHIAKQYGYQPEGWAYATTTGPTIIPKKKAPWRDITRDQVIDAVQGSALWSMVEAFQVVTDPPLPIEYTLPKAIALAGCALSGRAKTEEGNIAGMLARGVDAARVRILSANGQVCNVYAMIAAESGGGKDIGGSVDTLAYRRGYSLGDTGSAEGLADCMIERGSGLLVIPEFKNWLDPSHWQHKAGSFITSTFDKGYFRIRLSTRTKDAPERESKFCFPSLLANVQPGVIQRYATGTDVSSGMLGRFLYTIGPRHYGRPACTDNRRLLDAAEASLMVYERKAGAVDVPAKYLADVYSTFAKNDAPIFSAWTRLVNQYGPRLAVMLSVRPDDTSPFIRLTDDDWRRAGLLVQWFYTAAESLLTDIHEDPTTRALETLCAKILRFINNNPTCTLADISHACGRGSSSKQRREAVSELCDRGEIILAAGRYHPATEVMQGVA